MRLGQLADYEDAAVYRVVAHHAPAPAGFVQLVAGDHLITPPGERHQHLHDARLEVFVAALPQHFERRRTHLHPAQLEGRFQGEIDHPRRKIGVHRLFIGRPSPTGHVPMTSAGSLLVNAI